MDERMNGWTMAGWLASWMKVTDYADPYDTNYG